MYMVDKNKQYIIWARNAKVGGRSLNKAFSGVYADDNFKGRENITLKPEYGKIIEVHSMGVGFALGIDEFKLQYPKVWEESFKFIVVRNPYDKWVSAWYSTKQLKDNFTFKELINIDVNKFCKNYKPYDNWVRHIEYHLTKPQSEYVMMKNGELDIDLILKFENLNEEYNKLRKLTGIFGHNLEHLGNSNHESFKDYYDEETANFVYEKFENDFRLFGYDKNSWK